MRKTKLVVAIAAAVGMGWGTMVQAGALTNVDVLDGNGNLLATNVAAFDWNESGSGVGVGIGPFGAAGPLTPGSTFTLLYQANLVGFSNFGAPSGLVSAGSGGAFSANEFEFTIVASFTEEVIQFDPLNNAAGTPPDFVQIDPVPGSGTISIFYDSLSAGGSKSSVIPGTGFDDGIEVARFTVTGGTSTFTTTSTTTGIGTTDFGFNLVGALDVVDSDYIVGVLGATIIDLHFTSNQQVPAGTSDTDAFHVGGSATYPDYPVDDSCAAPGTCDIVFKVDGSNQFSVPEPSSILLLGIGMMGLGFAGRRRLS